MHYYWAEFIKLEENIFRFDTRIYLKPIEGIKSHDHCVGGIVGKNPGSAKSSHFGKGIQPLILDKDKLLPTVRNIITKAYEAAEVSVPKRGYVQILNLFYLCNPSLKEGIKQVDANTSSKYCNTEQNKFDWVWYVWGGENQKLSPYKLRFSKIKSKNQFFFDKEKMILIDRNPNESDFAKHTQGLDHKYIIPYFTNLIKKQEKGNKNEL